MRDVGFGADAPHEIAKSGDVLSGARELAARGGLELLDVDVLDRAEIELELLRHLREREHGAPWTVVPARRAGDAHELGLVEEPLVGVHRLVGVELERIDRADRRERQLPVRRRVIVDARLEIVVVRHGRQREVRARRDHVRQDQIDRRAPERGHVGRVLAGGPLDEHAAVEHRDLGLFAALVGARARDQLDDAGARAAVRDVEAARDVVERIDRLRRQDRAERDRVIEQRHFEVVDQDLRVLRRRAADHQAGKSRRQLRVDDARHRRQRAHEIAAGARDALCFGAIDLGRAGRVGRWLALDLDRLVALRLGDHHDVVDRSAGHRAERGLEAALVDDDRRAERRLREPIAAITPRRHRRGRAFDHHGRTADRAPQCVDHASGNRDRRRSRRRRRIRARSRSRSRIRLRRGIRGHEQARDEQEFQSGVTHSNSHARRRGQISSSRVYCCMDLRHVPINRTLLGT